MSDAVLARLSGKFEVQELAPVTLKGKERAMRIYDVKRLAPAVQVPAALGG